MVLSEGWKVREITSDKAGNVLHFEIEEDVQTVLCVHGLLVCPLSPHITLAGVSRGKVSKQTLIRDNHFFIVVEVAAYMFSNQVSRHCIHSVY